MVTGEGGQIECRSGPVLPWRHQFRSAQFIVVGHHRVDRAGHLCLGGTLVARHGLQSAQCRQKCRSELFVIKEFRINTRDSADHVQQVRVRALQVGDATQQAGGGRRRDEQSGDRIAGLLETQGDLEGQQRSHAVPEERHLARRCLFGFEHRTKPIGHLRDAGVLRQVLAGPLARILHSHTFRAGGECPGERHVELGRTAGVGKDVQPGPRGARRIGRHLDRNQPVLTHDTLNLLVAQQSHGFAQ